jgi:transcriptional regulator with XRE-family HTH domain
MFRSSSRSRRTPLFQRQAWGEQFGSFLRDAREERGRSVEEAAEASGLSIMEWEAVEAGQVPRTWQEICRMADAIEADRMGMASLVLFCREAWD